MKVIYMTNNRKHIYIIQGTDDNVERFFKAMEILWGIKGLKIQKLKQKECDILSNLSDNQKKILNLDDFYCFSCCPRHHATSGER